MYLVKNESFTDKLAEGLSSNRPFFRNECPETGGIRSRRGPIRSLSISDTSPASCSVDCAKIGRAQRRASRRAPSAAFILLRLPSSGSKREENREPHIQHQEVLGDALRRAGGLIDEKSIDHRHIHGEKVLGHESNSDSNISSGVETPARKSGRFSSHHAEPGQKIGVEMQDRVQETDLPVDRAPLEITHRRPEGIREKNPTLKNALRCALVRSRDHVQQRETRGHRDRVAQVECAPQRDGQFGVVRIVESGADIRRELEAVFFEIDLSLDALHPVLGSGIALTEDWLSRSGAEVAISSLDRSRRWR